MDPFVRGFIRASLVWLGIGVLIGLAVVFFPGTAGGYRAAHMHANLLGFVSMMIFGVAYHVIPRFTGNPLASPSVAHAHLWVANLGLAGMVGGWIVRPSAWGLGSAVLGIGAVLSAAGAFAFIYNIWRTTAPRPTRVNTSPLVGLSQPGAPGSR
jgi:drug/metabolite transporter (DMT)-like permease